MPRTVAALTGILASAALVYQFRHDIDTNTDKIRSKLGSIRGNLDGVAKGSPTSAYTAPQQYTPAIPHITQTTTYISDRLVPEVKSTWNDHVMAAARSLNRLNLWEDASRLWNEKILGNASPKH